MSTTQKTVLITGANAGIGLALAQLLLENNYKVIGTSRNGIIKEINNPNFIAIPLELTDTASIKKASALLRTTALKLDILINNAGIAPDINTLKPDLASMRETFNTNVFGLVDFTETVLDIINGNGQILNISSQMGVLNKATAANGTAYRMSKTALNMYTRTLAIRLESRTIAVSSIHPGWVQTKLATHGAPLTTAQAATGILKLLASRMKTGTFWNAATQEEMPW